MHEFGSETLEGLLAYPVLEVFPSPGIEERVAQLPEGTRLSVTCSPAKGVDATLALSGSLRREGFTVVPHISARLVDDHRHLEAICRRLTDLGIGEIFVIGGDLKQPAGRFSSAHDLLAAMAELGHGFDEVGVAAYPEGHPTLSDETLWRHLRAKQPLATYTVTQMCFDAETILTWIDRAHREGIALRVVIGLPGVVQRRKLLSLSLKIGVGDSTRFIAKHSDLTAKLMSSGRYSPENLVTRLALEAERRRLPLGGLHIYTFNQIDGTVRWRTQMLSSVGGERGAGS
ncbi:MAG: methylenetetrahydrofolate reductase [Actinomycetota bacterium]|nr:methylenetetrahydrofolate reductase [Actinomycetota bacterium]